MSRWRIADGVAWVADEQRVALIDPRKGAAAVPMHISRPFSLLWESLASGGVAGADLLDPATEVAGDEAHDFIRAFVDPLTGIGVLERVVGE